MDMDEQTLIDQLIRPLACHSNEALGLKDDTAIIPPFSDDLVITKDALVANVHFFADDPLNLIAKKALRTNLSDLAAMGAIPRYYLMAMMLPEDLQSHELRLFYQGLKEDQERYSVVLIGGDTVTHSGALSISITAIGQVGNKQALRRNGASKGDYLYVSGTIGDSYLGLQLKKQSLKHSDSACHTHLEQRYLLPEPRTQLAIALQQRAIASACLDISDGLAQDAAHLANLSNLTLFIDTDTIPLSDAAQTLIDQRNVTIEALLTGGDDYELLFTSTTPADQMQQLAQETNTRITLIGQAEANTDSSYQSVEFYHQNRMNKITLPHNKGYQHRLR